MRKLRQLGLLMWKNFMLQRRRPIGTLVQIGLPFFMSLIYLALRLYLIDATHYDAVTWPEYNISSPPPNLKRSFKIAYSTNNGSDLSKNFTDDLKYYLNENAYHRYNQNISIHFFQSESLMVNEIADASGGFIGGIYFSTLPDDQNNIFDYTLRFTISDDSNNPLAKNGHEWLTKYVFPKFQLPQPRNKDKSVDEKPSYYEAGFLLTQYAVDRAIIKQFGPIPATVLMQKFPFPSYVKDAFILIIQQFMPNFFVIAFIYTALVIVRSIVYEKEKRLKETLKMIGVDNWLHWVAWYIQSLIICLICIIIMTLMFTIKFNDHGKVINQSSPTVFFVFLLLYIHSGIMFCFFLSVFFSKASTAAAGGGILWYLTFIPFFFIAQSYDEMSLSLKAATCLIPNLGMALGSIVIGKFEGTGIGVHWDNLSKGASVDDDFSLGIVFIMMIINSIIYGILTWYIENVFPGEFGTPKPCYFPFTKSYWCGSFKKVSDSDQETLPLLGNRHDKPSEKFEKDPEGLGVGIDIKDLVKIYDGETGKKVAVNEVSLKMYEGQITVLLGHNGAGKTSLMSVLTGFYSPSGGTATVNGYDIRTSMDGVRSSLGLCPQHDVLYDTLTVKEHLWFFGRLKGMTRAESAGEIEKMLDSIKLADKCTSQTRYLSGGMKRKLSLGLALIGKAKVLMLDEPTSGMDPSARRFTWDLLQNYRSGRTILLTTHFMDEADVLGDRIAIMADGKIQCCGSSLFLKNHYGVGYHIVMVKQPDCKVRKVTELVRQFVPHAKLESNAGAELSYILPRQSSQNFSTLFAKLEDKHEELGIASYGASMTTMEEVFMKVGIESDETLDDKLKATYGGNAEDITASVSSIGTEETPNGVNNRLNAIGKPSAFVLNTGMLLYLQRWIAMFKKRYLHSRRHKIAIISQLLMPLVFTLFALIAAETIPKPEDSTAMFDSNYAPFGTVGSFSSVSSSLAKSYTKSASSNTRYQNITHKAGYKGNMTKYLIHKASGEKLGSFNRHCFIAATFERRDDNVTAKSWFNDQAYHAVAVSLSAVDNAILKDVSKNSSKQITVTNHPLPRTLKQKSDDLDNNAVGLNVAFNLLFGMAFLASSFVVFVVQERTNGAKHVQFVSGVDPFSYWTASWAWDLINFTFPCICIIILFACFDVPAYTGGNRLGIVFLVLILYGFAIIPFMYLFSFLFKMASKAYIRLTLLNIVTGLVALLLVYIIQALGYADTADAFNWIFFLLPNFSLGQTFSNIFTNYNRIRLYDDFFSLCIKVKTEEQCIAEIKQNGLSIEFQRDYLAWDTPGVGRFVLILPLEGILFMLMVLFIDYNIARSLKSLARGHHVDPFDAIHQEVATDSDVLAEQKRVLDGEAQEDVLVINDLTKVFKVPGRQKFAAVDHLTLGVPLGECFGLLGVNGAGKTTTFKMLTGDEIPTSGTASVDSFDIQADLNMVRQRTGYCPQFDALIDLMTGREMLRMYAALRGVPTQLIDLLVEDLMKSVLLTEHADKLTKTYSGGNKRKLSAAIALVGEPLVVFLDEPTTGMDPVARRLLWNTLCRVRAEGRCLVITSHSMEECEALCTRLAIMVNGKFRCLGSPQHLKNKFVQGFTLLVNVPDDTQPDDTHSLKEFVANTFPGSLLRDEHNGLLNYHLAGSNSSWSVLFATLEDAHSRGIIGNYAVTQTSLEQIFLNFARSQRGYDD
ncbi:ATP-binding cassette sub-family A member 3-like [Dendronephthya gigantea]|uniref:ATP-binding cassette sub-family A member 3-like n=1 Tax=Dendronephthya gigantea TaxID=151771 RepID=UPI001068DB5A|nr:ATP-binding cassette sub-family A member 3-like [Dendronephthya gigantea]